jgi:hypothetical protein
MIHNFVSYFITNHRRNMKKDKSIVLLMQYLNQSQGKKFVVQICEQIANSFLTFEHAVQNETGIDLNQIDVEATYLINLN